MVISSVNVKTSRLGAGAASESGQPWRVADGIAAGPGANAILRNGRLPSATASVTRRRALSDACVNVPQADAADQKHTNLAPTPMLMRGMIEALFSAA